MTPEQEKTITEVCYEKAFGAKTIGIILTIAMLIALIPAFDAPTLAEERIGDDGMFLAPADGVVGLTADIDLSGAEWVPIGADDTAPFTGTFDGQGYVIKFFAKLSELCDKSAGL